MSDATTILVIDDDVPVSRLLYRTPPGLQRFAFLCGLQRAFLQTPLDDGIEEPSHYDRQNCLLNAVSAVSPAPRRSRVPDSGTPGGGIVVRHAEARLAHTPDGSNVAVRLKGKSKRIASLSTAN